MSDRLRFTRTSGLPNDTLSFEVAVNGKTVIELGSLDDKKWELWFTDPVKISWQEFIEISYELQKFIAEENEIVIDNLQKDNVDDEN